MEAAFEEGQGPEGAVVPWMDGWMDGWTCNALVTARNRKQMTDPHQWTGHVK
jgi:hypothetical protein